MCCSWHRSSFSPSLFYSSTNMETRRGSGKYLPSHNWSPARHFSACGSLQEETTYLIKIHLLSTLDTPPLDCLLSQQSQSEPPGRDHPHVLDFRQYDSGGDHLPDCNHHEHSRVRQSATLFDGA